MRYLNKIVFINSADKSLKYAEVSLDGNVHFIGTQGVGKSTLLRAILFFYNADTQKLGIPREKKTYNEYYLPYQNSYIVYEVQTETGKFCVLTFKSQGRVAFRFFDSGYDKNYFIDREGKAFETWEKTRGAFGKDIGYTRIINNYEEYRNILYGNNKTLPNEFRKYALLESKQFQNIPRTIANVFLNAKLDAEFVKETIIKSLNEEEVKIDLTTYSQTHLRDFEANMNDIKKWIERNRNGENQIEKQAERIATNYSALIYSEHRKKELACQLGWSLNSVKKQQPKVQEQLKTEELKRNKVKVKQGEMDSFFDERKSKKLEDIGKYNSKLKDIKDKRDEYNALKIETILTRVSKKSMLDLEKGNLSEEKGVLTSKFLEIQQRYEAQLRQVENQLKEFENSKQAEINTENATFIQFKDEMNKQYELIYEDIREQYKEELEVANSNTKRIENTVTDTRIKHSEIKHRRFYETEIENCKNEILNIQTAITKAETHIQQANEKSKNLRNEWEIEERMEKEDCSRKIALQAEEEKRLFKNISAIDSKIDNSKDSLYGWLNQYIPDWDKTIGKIIDEENVLFHQGLNPQKITTNDLSLYGISINTNEISKKVKTVADLQQEREDFNNQIQIIKKTIADLNAQSNEELEKLRKKFRLKINEQKEIIQSSEYNKEQSKSKIEEFGTRLTEWQKKGIAEKNVELENNKIAIEKLNEEKIKAEEQIQKIESSITKSIEIKKKEKEAKIKNEHQKLKHKLNHIELQTQEKRKIIEERSEAIRNNQKKELDNKGADTKRIGEIDLQLSIIGKELGFIEDNISATERYKYDKEQLFDNEDIFKNKKLLLEKQLKIEADKHKQQKEKLDQQIGIHTLEIETIKEILNAFENDLTAFGSLTKTELYQTIETFVLNYSENDKTDFTCSDIIDELNKIEHLAIKRYMDLQEAVNKFTGNFQENNLFNFKINIKDRTEYFEFAEMLKEFIEENKISEYKQRVEERFAHIIKQIGRETNDLISKEGEISQVIREINNDFVARNFVGAIKSMELKTDKSANRIFQLLVEIKNFNNENPFDIGKPNLFSSNEQANKNEKAISLLKHLIKEMAMSKEKEITLSDSFELLFKIVENDNDTGWVEKLTNVGSEGTDILVKAMINIMLLNVFKEKAARKHKDNFRLHCMMDEIGKLHPNNVKGVLKFANDRNILLINSSPTSYNATDYRYTYLLVKDSKNVTIVKPLVRKVAKLDTETVINT